MSLRVCVEPLVSRGSSWLGWTPLMVAKPGWQGSKRELRRGLLLRQKPCLPAPRPRLSLAPTPRFSGPRRPPSQPSHPSPAPSPGLGERLRSLVRGGWG